MNIDTIDPTTMTNIILALLPFIASFAYYLFTLVDHRLPKKQLEMLGQIVTYAVQMVEQQYPDAGGSAKKKLAETIIADIFKAFKLPVPSPAAIDAALESTVFLLQQVPSVAASKQAKAQQINGTTHNSASTALPTPGGGTSALTAASSYTPLPIGNGQNHPNTGPGDMSATIQSWSNVAPVASTPLINPANIISTSLTGNATRPVPNTWGTSSGV